MTKTKRNLSGIYFRSQNEETKKWENVCFEDLPSEEQTEIIESKSEDFVRNLAKMLADTINEIGDKLDIMKD